MAIDFQIAGLQEAMDEAFDALAEARAAPKETAEAARDFTADCKAATKQIRDSHDDFKFQLTKLGNSRANSGERLTISVEPKAPPAPSPETASPPPTEPPQEQQLQSTSADQPGAIPPSTGS